VAAWRRRPEDIPDVADVVASLASSLNRDASRQAGRLFTAAGRIQADLGALARHRHREDELVTALDGGDRLFALLQSLADSPHETHPHVVTAEAERASFDAELARLRAADDPVAWAAAATAWDRLGRPHRRAYCLWREAELLLADGRSKDAAVTLRQAAESATEMEPLLARITGLADRARIALDPDAPASGPSAHQPYGLTAREMSVLAQLTRGSTNRQIAKDLYISEKTVSVHVSNILRKLDVTSRTQAATRAEREDLVAEPVDPLPQPSRGDR